MISFFVVWVNEFFTHEPSNPNLGCYRVNTEYVEEKQMCKWFIVKGFLVILIGKAFVLQDLELGVLVI